jgi:DNA-binding CsgD family transcriptional regulator
MVVFEQGAVTEPCQMSREVSAVYSAWDIRDKSIQEQYSDSTGQLWASLSAPIRELLRSDNILIIEHDFGCNQGDIPYSTGISAGLRDRYRHDVAAQNVWLQALRSHHPQDTYVGTELVPNWELVGTQFYRRWLRPQQVLHALVGVISSSRETMRCLFALRPASQEPFASSDKKLLRSFLPELRSASDVTAEIASLQQMATVLLDLFDEFPDVAVIVDEAARAVLLNAAAKALVERADGMTLVNGVLVCASPRDTYCLHEAISAVLLRGDGDRSGRRVVIGRESSDAPIALQVVALQHPVADADGHTTVLAAVFVSSFVDSDALAGCLRFYGMTRAETRLAAMIVDGRRLLEAARELHISRNTARTHMKHIYAKTETHSQPELLRLLMRSSRSNEGVGSAFAVADQWLSVRDPGSMGGTCCALPEVGAGERGRGRARVPPAEPRAARWHCAHCARVRSGFGR